MVLQVSGFVFLFLSQVICLRLTASKRVIDPLIKRVFKASLSVHVICFWHIFKIER